MNLDIYNNSSGLNKLCYKELENILDILPENANILEFGSGTSTKFLVDYILKNKKKFNIDSFDNDINFAYILGIYPIIVVGTILISTPSGLGIREYLFIFIPCYNEFCGCYFKLYLFI